MNPTKAYISLKEFRNNLKNIRRHTKDKKILVAVKADAYGHGDIKISEFIQNEKLAEYLGVATSNEALNLRRNGITLPVLKFTQCFDDELEALIENDIDIAAYSYDFLKYAADFTKKNNKNLNIHIKIDTGMGRVGLKGNEYKDVINLLKQNPQIKVKGIMTHFAASDSRDKEFTNNQNKIFRKAIEKFAANSIKPEIIHAANSGAVIDHPETWYDMVRPGIMCYGYYPSNETSQSVMVKPVMTLTSRISFIKKVSENTPVSYGMTYKTPSENFIATIPAGYGDGYNRLLSNRGIVSLKGREYKVSGRVCMDQFMIDIEKNDLNIKVGDEVILFGEKKGNSVSLEYLCSMVNTISYELLCNISKRVPRIYIDN